MLVLTPQMVTQALLTAKYINQIADAHKKTVLTSFVGGESIFTARQFLIKEKIPHFNFPNDAARSLGLIMKWIDNKNSGYTEFKTFYKPSKVNLELSKTTIGRAIDLPLAQKLFREYEIPLLPSKIYKSIAELREVKSELEYPVVLKLTHPALIHKTEFKAVRLDIKDEVMFMEEARDLEKAAHKGNLEGFKFEVQPFIRDMLEVIVGVKKDQMQHKVVGSRDYLRSKGFGHVMLFGAGGIYTELYDDIEMALLPVSRDIAVKLIENTKVGKIIKGVRGQKFEFEKIVAVITSLSNLVINNTNIAEIDINPLFVTKDDVYAADIKIFAS